MSSKGAKPQSRGHPSAQEKGSLQVRESVPHNTGKKTSAGEFSLSLKKAALTIPVQKDTPGAELPDKIQDARSSLNFR